MSKIHQLQRVKGNSIISYLVLSDVHSLHYDEKAFKLIQKAFLTIPKSQRRIILLGDILDCEDFYPKAKKFQDNIKIKNLDDYFIPCLEEELNWYEKFHEKLKKLTTKPIHFVEGNHEQRLRRPQLMDHVPHAYRHNFNLEKQLHLIDKDIKFTKYNDFLKVNDLLLTHGMFCGANPIKKHVDILGNAGTGIIFGHTHEVGVTSFKSLSKTVIGYNNPCLCKTENVSYLEGRPHNWSVGFTMVHQTRKNVHVNIYNIHNNELVFDGRLFK